MDLNLDHFAGLPDEAEVAIDAKVLKELGLGGDLEADVPDYRPCRVKVKAVKDKLAAKPAAKTAAKKPE